MTTRKLHIRFQKTPRSITLNVHKLLQVQIFTKFCRISQICEATTAINNRSTFSNLVALCYSL